MFCNMTLLDGPFINQLFTHHVLLQLQSKAVYTNTFSSKTIKRDDRIVLRLHVVFYRYHIVFSRPHENDENDEND